MEEQTKSVTTTLALLLFALSCIECAPQEKECSSGAACFPQGSVPDGITSKDPEFYCCPDEGWTRLQTSVSGSMGSCRCRQLTLDEKIEQWADNTMHEGRMCGRGDEHCEDVAEQAFIGDRFTFCCWRKWYNNTAVRTDITVFKSDQNRYIGCRCKGHPVPTPDPKAYIVPPVASYNSSGETCAYDDGCDYIPALKCQTTGVTFCCYGSRGLVTTSEGRGITRCTCTNEIFGAVCASKAVPILQSSLPCLTDCRDRTDEEKCTDDNGNEQCCPYNMALVSRQQEGSFTSCECRATAVPRAKVCATSSALRLARAAQDLVLVGTMLMVALAGSGGGH